MTYQEFKRELCRSIRNQEAMEGKTLQLLEKGTEYTQPEVLRILRLLNRSCYGKEHGKVREDIIYVTWGQRGQLQLLHWKVRRLFERFQSEGWQGILPEILVKLENVPEDEELLPEMPERSSYQQSCSRIIVRPVNYIKNQEWLQDGIYQRYGDIALVLYALLCERKNEYSAIRVNRFVLEHWGLPREVLFDNALWNSSLRMPPRLFDGRDDCTYHSWKEGVFMPEEKGNLIFINHKDYWSQIFGYRLTTTGHRNGAAAIYYPGVQERLAQLLGGDYYVSFPNVHEAIIHPVRHKQLADIKSAIRESNVVFDEKEMLTNSVYRYSTARKGLIEV